MNDTFQLKLETDPPPEDMEFIFRQLADFNEGNAGPASARDLTMTLRQGSELVGGFLGMTHWNWLCIRYLWISDSLRRRGLGSRMMQAAEQEALARGCSRAHLDTFSFQALAFYEKLEYTIFGCLEGYPPGFSRIYLQKTLTTSTSKI